MSKKNKSYMSNIFEILSGVFQKNEFLRKFKSIYTIIDDILLTFIKCPKLKDSGKKNILIVFNIALGDGVIFRCVALKLRKIFPKQKYNLTLVCQKGIEKLYTGDNVFDEILPLDFNKATLNLIERFKNYRSIRSKHYDIVLDPVGIREWTTNIFITNAACATTKIGLFDIDAYSNCSKKKISRIYTDIIEMHCNNLHLLDIYATFFNKYFGKKVIKPGLEKPKFVDVKIDDIPEKYFIVFPSASIKLKRWSIKKFVELTNLIYKKLKMPLVLVGTELDREILCEYSAQLKIPYIDKIGKTNLNEYISIIINSSLIVSNDTSAYHIGVMGQIPTVLISGGYTNCRYAQYDFERKNEFQLPCVVTYPMECFDCNNWCGKLNCKNENWPCLEAITVDYAWKKIEKYIDLREVK